jgi:hypothetical protein
LKPSFLEPGHDRRGAGLQTCHAAIPGGMVSLPACQAFTRKVGSKTDFAGPEARSTKHNTEIPKN